MDYLKDQKGARKSEIGKNDELYEKAVANKLKRKSRLDVPATVTSQDEIQLPSSGSSSVVSSVNVSLEDNFTEPPPKKIRSDTVTLTFKKKELNRNLSLAAVRYIYYYK